MEAVLKKKNNGEKIPYLHIHPQGSDEDGLFAAKEYDHDFGTNRWDTLNRYLMHGGRMNFYNLFCYINNLLFQDKSPCNPLETLPQEGIYHPDFKDVRENAAGLMSYACFISGIRMQIGVIGELTMLLINFLWKTENLL